MWKINNPIGLWVSNESRRGKVSQVVRTKKTDVEVSFPVLVLLGRFFKCIYKGMCCIWYILFYFL